METLPGTDVESVMLSILRTQLGEPDMGAEDDFYAMGGDSLIALRVVADAERAGVPITLRDLLFHPSARQLAAAARPERAETAAPVDVLSALDRAMLPPGVATARPASTLQLGLIYLCDTSGDPRMYHDLVGVRVDGPLREAALARALGELCARHEALRSSFDLGEFSVPVQLVWSSITTPLTVERATDDAAVARWRERRLENRIDHGRPPLFHCHVVALPSSFHVTLAIHHAIIDGWSYARLMVELLTLYEAAVAGRPAELPEVPATGHDEFLALERAAVADTGSADFWHSVADVPPLLFRPDQVAGTADPARTASFPVGRPLLDGLRRAAAEMSVPVKSLVLACHARALGRWAHRDRDVVTGLTMNGRPEIPEADALVGLFLNTVPLRFATTAGTWPELARTARDEEQRALAHRRYPLARIEQRLGRRSFDVSFNFTHFHTYRDLDHLSRLRLDRWWSFDKTSFPMLVDFMIDSRRSGTAVEVAYDPRLVSAGKAEEYLGLYRHHLHEAAGL